MAIELDRETELQMIESIQQYFEENLESSAGDLKASLLLKYILAEIGPTIYNQAITDAARHLQGVADELDAVCYQPEFTFWNR